MGKPKIIGYCDEYEATPLFHVGSQDISEPVFVRCRPMYEERQFHASLVLDLYHVYCKNCMTTTIVNTDRLPHDVATDHRCLYSPGER